MPQSNWNSLKKKLVTEPTKTSSSSPSSSSTLMKHGGEAGDAVDRGNDDGRHDKVSRRGDDSKKRKRTDINDILNKQKQYEEGQRAEEIMFDRIDRSKYVGLDCEMVGTGVDGKVSVLARACLVNFDGDVIYDEFVRPESFVTDFRTKYSGVRKKNLREGKAVSFQECINAVHGHIKGKILVGHALHNDLAVLHLQNIHQANIRDTARYKPYMRARNGTKLKPRSLKELAKQYLGTTIQDGEHDPGVDARTAMELYKRCLVDWEKSLKSNTVKSVKGVGKMKQLIQQQNGAHVKKLDSMKPSLKAKKKKMKMQQLS